MSNLFLNIKGRREVAVQKWFKHHQDWLYILRRCLNDKYKVVWSMANVLTGKFIQYGHSNQLADKLSH